jgi:hypothetical protein
MQIVQNSQVKNLILGIADCINMYQHPDKFKHTFKGQRFHQIFIPADMSQNVKEAVIEILRPTFEVMGFMFASICEYKSYPLTSNTPDSTIINQ